MRKGGSGSCGVLATPSLWGGGGRGWAGGGADPHTEAGDILPVGGFPGTGTARGGATRTNRHAARGPVGRGPPLLGEHSDAVLTELGYSQAEIAALKADGAYLLADWLPRVQPRRGVQHGPLNSVQGAVLFGAQQATYGRPGCPGVVGREPA